MSDSSSRRYSKLVRASALYDVILSFAFALPVVAGLKIDLLHRIHDSMQLNGSFPSFEPLHLLFVNFFGMVVMVWSVLRLYNPIPLYGLADGIGRLLFTVAMLNALFVFGASQIIWLFWVPELAWGLAQIAGYIRLRNRDQIGLASR